MKVRKYYKYGGNTPNVIIKGNPTIVDGVAGNFSRSNYLKLPKGFAPGNNTWEIVFKYTTGTTVQGGSVFGNYGYTYQNAPEISHNTDKKYNICIPKDGSNTKLVENTVGSYIILPNTTYWVKLEYTGTKYNMEYSLDGETYIQNISVSNSTPIFQAPEGFCIGVNLWDNSTQSQLVGTIDLKECYIKVNNQIWWTGTVTETDETDYDFYRDLTIYPPVKAITEKKRNYYVYNNVPNVSIIGKPCIKKGIVNEFGNGNYIRINKTITQSTNIEIICKAKLRDVVTTSGANNIIFHTTSSDFPVGFTSSRNLGLWNSSTWQYGSTVYPLDEWIWVKTIWDGTSYKVYGMLDNDYTLNTLPDNWTLETTWTTSTNKLSNNQIDFGYNINWTVEYLDGFLSLRDCLIKIDGKIWWGGTEYQEYGSQPHPNGTIIGNVENNNNVLSNFSSYNYFKANTSFAPGSNTWELNLKIKTAIISDDDMYLFTELNSTASNEILIRNKKLLFCIIKDYDSLMDIPSGSYIVQPNTIYWLKWKFTGTQYILSYSLNGTTYVDDITVSNSTPCYNGNPLVFGSDWNGSTLGNPFNGSIYMEDCNFKINNETVWTGVTTDSNYDFYKDTYTYKVINDSIEQTCKIFL